MDRGGAEDPLAGLWFFFSFHFGGRGEWRGLGRQGEQGARWKKVESLRRDVEEGKGKKRGRGGRTQAVGPSSWAGATTPHCVNKHARSNTVRTCSVPLCLYPFLVLDYDYDYGYD